MLAGKYGLKCKQSLPDFVNGTRLIETTATQEELNDVLKTIEKACGRIKSDNTFGPRTIDLDVAVWNDQIIDPDVHERDFLKQAIRQILPHLDLDLKK